MLVLLLLIVTLSFLVVVALFGDSPTFRNTPIHRLHYVLLRANSLLSERVTSSPTIYSALRWSVPLFYCVVVTTCVSKFFKDVYPQLLLGLAATLYVYFTIGLVVASTVLVTFADPGTVNFGNLDAKLAQYKNNGLIFFGKRCATCNFEKPARSKHCSVCKRCISLYDHHCIWVNNCIGERNYCWFVAYLLANINLLTYGAYLTWSYLSNEPRPQGYWKLIIASRPENKTAGTLLILCVIFAAITSAFTSLHIRYMYLGVTTNEADKWGEIEHLVRLGVLFFIPQLGVYAERATLKSDDGTYQEVYISLDNEDVLFSSDKEAEYTIDKVTSMETDLDNIYDKGFFNNVKERLSPRY